jgi:hypothetical protein
MAHRGRRVPRLHDHRPLDAVLLETASEPFGDASPARRVGFRNRTFRLRRMDVHIDLRGIEREREHDVG